jgi:hypothetical protein
VGGKFSSVVPAHAAVMVRVTAFGR